MANHGIGTDRELAGLIRRQVGLITRGQALSAGMTMEAVRYRVRPGGRWYSVLPGVYYSSDGVLTPTQRGIAASLYVGGDCVLTGTVTLMRHGVTISFREIVDVLIPPHLARQNFGFVTVHRTRRMPEAPVLADGVRYAPVPRAIGDACRRGMDSRSVIALVASAIQRRQCTFAELAAELRAGPPQGSALFREALAQAAAGPASVAETDLRKLIIRSGLPTPLFNPRLYVGSRFLAQPDAWWPDAGVACEVDSREWHLLPEDWQRTQARHTRISAHGIIVFHFSPRRIRTDAKTINTELRSAIDVGRSRPPLAIITYPADRAIA